MAILRAWSLYVVLVAGSAFVPSTGRAEGSPAAIPDSVMRAFASAFPKSQILEWEMENESGVTIYDVEFRQGGAKKEADVAADGTVLEVSIVVHARSVPPAAMKALRDAARGAKIRQIECVQISHQTKDGKVIELPAQTTQYEAEMAKGRQKAEVTVGSDGIVVEPAVWRDAAAKETEGDGTQ